MAKEPFLPLFFGDFLASTTEWRGEERALYMLLLGYQWVSSAKSLPSDPRRICAVAGWDWPLFEQCWVVVSTKFPEQGGRRANARLEDHRERSKEVSEKRAIAGAKGGATTQAKAKQLLEQKGANASNLLGHPSHPIPSQSSPDSQSDTHHSVATSVGAEMRAARAPTATRLPADFELTQSRREVASREGVDPEREFPRFTDYWRASSGANARKHDWDATWRNWCRKAQDMRGFTPSNARRPLSEALTTAELEARETRRLSEEGRSATEIASELAMPLDQVQEILRNGHARQ
jgi:uncharacterized protein YdaU (DUF1376 family)